MKAKRFLAAFCLGLTVLICVTTIIGIQHQPANGSIPVAAVGSTIPGTIAGGFPQFGSSSAKLTMAGTASNTAVFNLGSPGSLSNTGTSSSMTATGSGSIPCYNTYMTLVTTGTVLIGSTSASCTYPVFQTLTSGTATAGVVSYPLPQLTNVNQLYMSLTCGSAGSSTTADVELIYTQ